MTADRRLTLVPGDRAYADALAFRPALQRSWEAGLLVARSAAPGSGGPRLTGRKPASYRRSFREFAEIAGVHRDTVRSYFGAWQRAAAAGLVPDASELVPGQDVDLSAAKAAETSWDDFYSAKAIAPDAAAEWAEAGFEYEPMADGFRLVLTCDSEAARQDAIAKLQVPVAKATGKTLSARYPPREQEDLSSLRFEPEAGA